jgi:hypothetical protein
MPERTREAGWLGALRYGVLDLLDRPSNITLLTIGYMIARGWPRQAHAGR